MLKGHGNSLDGKETDIIVVLSDESYVYHAKMPAAILASVGFCVTMLPELLRHSLTVESY